MNEAGYIRSINGMLPTDIHKWKTNVNFANGVPDCWYSGSKSDLWVEYKYVKSDPVRSAKPKLSVLQENWLKERHAEGRNVAVVIGCPSGGILYKGIEWIDPKSFKIISRKEIAEWLTDQVKM